MTNVSFIRYFILRRKYLLRKQWKVALRQMKFENFENFMRTLEKPRKESKLSAISFQRLISGQIQIQ